MPRLRTIPRHAVHAAAQPYFDLLFGPAGPEPLPPTGTGTPGNWWTVFANVPAVLDHATAGFQLYQRPDSGLDPALRELGQARAGYACGSRFVFSQHCKGCRDAGIAEEKIRALPAWSVADCFTPLERAVLAFTDALAWERGRVADDVFAVLKAHLDDPTILELTYVIGLYIMHATISRALHLEYDDVPEPVAEVPAPGGETGLAATLFDSAPEE